MGYAVFFLVILLSNIIQGITGFAGTILAMPPSLMLVGYDTAKPVLNVLGLLSGIYVFAGHRKHVCWGELKKIVAVMAAGIVGGIFLKGFFAGREREQRVESYLGLPTQARCKGRMHGWAKQGKKKGVFRWHPISIRFHRANPWLQAIAC